MAIDLINSLPWPINESYVLCDSWYSCKKIFKASEKAGFKYVGGLRTNRVVYPVNYERLEIKLNYFRKTLTKFRESKKKLGLDDYQIRSKKSIKRYLLIMMITYAYCGLEISEDTLKFSNGLKTARSQLEAEKL